MKKELQTVLHDTVRTTEDGYIFIEPVCEFFGINTLNQIEKLKKDEICQSDIGKKSDHIAFGDKRLRSVLGKKGFIRWIQIISPAIVRSNLQKLFVQYQVAVFDYLYQGSEARNTQLEDIRTYAININNAIHVKNHIMEYVGEQKNHRDLCLATPPEQWLQIRSTLTQTKAIPSGAEKLQPVNMLPNNIGQLKLMKKNLQTDIGKTKNKLKYQRQSKQPVENPMPDGFRREKLKLLMADKYRQIEDIDFRMMEILKQQEG